MLPGFSPSASGPDHRRRAIAPPFGSGAVSLIPRRSTAALFYTSHDHSFREFKFVKCFYMSIRNKISIYIVVTSLALIAALIPTSRIVVLGSFRKLEEQTVRRNVEQVLGKLANELRELNSVCYEYGVWDDTYTYIMNADEEYIRNNFYPEMFFNNRIDLFIDLSGALVKAAGFHTGSKQPGPTPEALMERISRYPALIHPPRTGKTAMLLVGGVPMLTASWPILPSKIEKIEGQK